MKIINCLFTTALGGMEQSFLDYNQIFTSLGHDVISLLHKNTKILPNVSGRYCLNNNRSKYDVFALCRLKLFLRREKPDLIVTHGNRAHYLLNKIKGDVPSIGVCHGSIGYITRSHKIITVSQSLREEIVGLYPHFSDRIDHIPNIVSLTPREIKQVPDFKQRVPVIGFMGRLDPEKGAMILVEALRRLKADGACFKALIAGDGSQRSQVETQINLYGLQSDVQLLGWVQDKISFYDKIDILCVPSLSESFGIVILEGLCRSIPVIVTELPGPREIVSDRQNGLVVPVNNPLETAEAIKLLVEDSSLYMDVARSGYKSSMAYSFEAIQQKVKRFIEEKSPGFYTRA